MDSVSVSVLISGAGPTGLTLGLELARRGVPVRIIDKEQSFTTASRGKAGIQPRTLEVFYDLGVIDKVLASGTQRLPFRRYRRDRLINETIPYLDNAPTQGEPFRRLHFMPQSRVEEILRERLAEYGVSVELGTELVEFDQPGPDRVTATLATAQGTEQVSAAYLVGCDGGRSMVRKKLGISFEGFTEEEKQLIVGDVEIDGLAPDAWYQWLDLDLGVVMLCPLSGTRSWQVQATPPADADGRPMEPSVEALQRAVDRATGMPIRVHDATWLSTSRINVRMADRLRVDQVFLAGDAAHVHPVLGALGANTGVQDAYNLGWKLALVLAGAAPELLDTYQEERLPVARWTLDTSVASTRAVFEEMTGGTGGAEAGLTQETLQLGIEYRASSLSRAMLSDTDGVQAGDRAPDSVCLDMTGQLVRLFDVFRGPHFTLLGFGAGCEAALREVAAAGPEDLRTCLLGERPTAYGLGADTLVLVRPDGYIGLTAPAGDGAAVLGYLGSLLGGAVSAATA
ncbi:FAD-dependent monooxygenase [Streptomyces sp. NPDC014006]|uniref:FAD-dependent monooxygenase n=1 Tax=Streptomyces sp. NPDC014006 TaxID=3364870 RepID=UPI0036FB2A94